MADDLKKKIAAAVRAARKQAGLTQSQLAELVNRDVDTVSNLERGLSLPPLKFLLAVAEALQTPVEMFLPVVHRSETKTGHRMALEVEIIGLLRQIPDERLSLARDQLALIASIDPPSPSSAQGLTRLGRRPRSTKS